MLEPVIKTIDVPCDQQKAFTVFVEAVDTWWPKDKNSVSAMQGAVAKRVVLEPKLHGSVVEIAHDDAEHRWGTVTTYDPYSRITLDWHINMPAENASVVDVVFTRIEENLTRVELTHSNWEVFGDEAANMRNGYDSGWVGVFESAYKAAASTSS